VITNYLTSQWQRSSFAPHDHVLTMLGQCLEWMRFVGQEQVALGAELGTIERVSSLTKKDVLALQTSYASRTLAEGRIHFGLARTKLLLALADWVKEFARIGEEPSIDDFDEANFLEALSVAEQRASIRALEKDSAGTRAREASQVRSLTRARGSSGRQALGYNSLSSRASRVCPSFM
jgi:hypothetical protein